MIDAGRCARHRDLAPIEVVGGTPGISLFDAEARRLPHTLDLVGRHPLGSQPFLPMSDAPLLVICAEDEGGVPGRPRAWVSSGRRGVSYRRGAPGTAC